MKTDDQCYTALIKDHKVIINKDIQYAWRIESITGKVIDYFWMAPGAYETKEWNMETNKTTTLSSIYFPYMYYNTPC